MALKSDPKNWIPDGEELVHRLSRAAHAGSQHVSHAGGGAQAVADFLHFFLRAKDVHIRSCVDGISRQQAASAPRADGLHHRQRRRFPVK